MNELTTNEYKQFVESIISKIHKTQYEALKIVNKHLVKLYWDIGCDIFMRQNEYGWGKSIVEDLSFKLKSEFPNSTGFSERNLWRMRNFYLKFQDEKNLPPIVAEISWTKIYVILEKCKDELEQNFYFKMVQRY